MSGVSGHCSAWTPSQIEISHGYQMSSWRVAKRNPGHGNTQGVWSLILSHFYKIFLLKLISTVKIFLPIFWLN